ncbi:MAG TPA: hypothetical protein PK777_03930 [Thermoguttaceae bacterium]|nr:hypothetical protein [Thermoguttaceae bacterium]
MSMFEDTQYRWRETYFVLFDARNRPTLEQVEEALESLQCRLIFRNQEADGRGRFSSMTVLSPDDFAALDICYTAGKEVTEEAEELFRELAGPDCSKGDRARLEKLRRATARFEVLHFEQVLDEEDDEDMLDPSTLLIVLESLANLTGGIAVDPQSGTFV